MIEYIIGGILAFALFLFVIAVFSWYRIVDPSEAHLVVTPTKKFVVSPDDEVATNGAKTYFAVPSWLPFFGRAIRILDVTIKEIVIMQETYEKSQARYNVKSSTKYRIKDVRTAAETFVSNEELQEQLKEVVSASVRAVTVKYDVVDARANKQKMSEEIYKEMNDDLQKWGLELVNFQLVDFQDTKDSSIISDISKRREVEIQSTTREQNAEKIKQARVKEAEAEENARKREIEKEKVIGEQEQLKTQKIAEMQKTAEEKRYEVVKVQTIKQAEITKEKAIVEANQKRDTERIYMEQKKLEGQGDRARAEEQAKGEAAPIREKGFAEAEAKEKLQAALNKFGDAAIRALVAEKVVEMQKVVGTETAKSLANADVKVFAGGGKAGEEGFELGKMIQAMSVANPNTADAVLNKIARPNDLGLTALGLEAMKETAKEKDKSTFKMQPKK
jgi:flotillin